MWIKETPDTDGWHWVKYKSKSQTVIKCPCLVTHVGESVVVHTARNSIFVAGPHHGGSVLTDGGKQVPGLRFWTEAIKVPN